MLVASEDAYIVLLSNKEIGWYALVDRGHSMELRNFCIATDARGKGIGRRLLRLLLASNICAGRDITHSVLKGADLEEFFKKEGFVVVWDDELTNVLRLPNMKSSRSTFNDFFDGA